MHLYCSTARCLAGVVALSLCLAVPGEARTKAAATPLTKREQADHALDRLTFGSRPGDVERMEAMGVERWIEQQLHPEKIDDSALDRRLSTLPAMQLSTEELMRRFPPPQTIRQLDAGKVGMPRDPVERAIYTNALANYREQRAAKAHSTETHSATMPAQGDTDVADLLRLSRDQRWNALLRMEPGTVRPLLQRMKPAERQQMVTGMSPEQKEILVWQRG